MIKKGLADIWGSRPVAAIDDYLIHETVGEAGKRGIPGLGRRNCGNSDARKRAMYAALSVLFVWLKRERKITSNPCADVARPGPPPARERTLKLDEMRWFWRACDAVGEPFGTVFKLLLLLGQRLNETAGLRRDELRDDEWHIPSSRAKNHKHGCRCRRRHGRSSRPCRASKKSSSRRTGARRRADGREPSAGSTRRCSSSHARR